MVAFTLPISSPLRSGFTRSIGAPNQGGHSPTAQWYIRFGMDFAAPLGTEVFAAFDGHVTRFNPHVPAKDSSKVYGAQIFIRSDNDKMGGFYTHLSNVPATLRAGVRFRRGEFLGQVFVIPRGSPHVHWALVEIIGGAPGGRYSGINLHNHFVRISNTNTAPSVTFNQDGSPPSVA